MYKEFNSDLSQLDIFDSGSESDIYLDQNRILKYFKRLNYFGYEKMAKKYEKLIILKSLNLDFHPNIYDFFHLSKFHENWFIAYTMQYLDHNKLNKEYLASLNFDQKKELILIIYKHLLEERKYNIYNLDIKLSNYYMSHANKLYSLDLDNFNVGPLTAEILPTPIRTYYQNYNVTSCDNLQDVSFTIFTLEFLLNLDFSLLDIKEIETIIYNSNFQLQLQKLIFDLFAYQNIDINELLTSLNEKSLKLVK